MKTESKENLIEPDTEAGSVTTPYDSIKSADDYVLTATEKKFLLAAERGDCPGVRRLLEEFKDNPAELNVNCVDPLNRSALIAAIENENIELTKILLEYDIHVNDALLHAISEEYVEGVELLLYHEETHHEPGKPYSWEAIDSTSSTFTPDITPLILAAHRNNYEILKLLLDRGATLPMPHDVRCGCDDCVYSSTNDSLRHSQSRINAYRALSSSSLIALSSRDPILTAFELSWELRRLSRMETEFRTEYNEMRQAVQEFAKDLLDHTRTSNELEIMLNFAADATIDAWEPGSRQTLERLKLAINYKQKQFVAHPSVQQLLASIWYEGLPGFRRKSMMGQLIQVAQLGCMFPVYSTIYMIAPTSEKGMFMKKPFVKFICHSTSYATFLLLLGAASQRMEYLALEFIGIYGNQPWMLEVLHDWKTHERGSIPGPTECCIMLFIVSLIWGEVNSLYSSGIVDYVSDLWNVIDFISNSFYVTWIGLRITSWGLAQRELGNGKNPWYPREQWDPYDPMLLSEGVFAAGMIFSFLKLVHIFSINPHLGPLQVSLGRMIIDIIKFFFIYTLVLFAFGCGLNQLLWYYADLEKQKCYHLHADIPDFDNNEKACGIWRRFANLFETSQSLFWASFGLVDLMAFELQGIKSFTRFWAMLMFGSYSVINIIVLLNMLIAMMSNSYQIISERSDTEWKFARTQLWMSYFEDGGTLPPPFNLCPTTKMMSCGKAKRSTRSFIRRSQDKAHKRHDNVMRLLVRRYITAEQRKRDDFGITEDDVMEIRQDISTLRFELIDIFNSNGMKTPNVNPDDKQFAGKKGKMIERRILKDFQIGIVETIINEAVQSATKGGDVFTQIAKAMNKRSASKNKKEDWNALVRKNTMPRDPIGSAQASSDRRDRRSLRRRLLEDANKGIGQNTDQIVEYNPKLSDATPVTRLAYIKFMKPALRREQIAEDAEDGGEAARGASGAAGAAGATAGLSVEKKQDVQKSILRVAKKMKADDAEAAKAESGEQASADAKPAGAAEKAPADEQVKAAPERPSEIKPAEPPKDDTSPPPKSEDGAASDVAKPAMLIPTTVITRADVTDRKDDDVADASDTEQQPAADPDEQPSGSGEQAATTSRPAEKDEQKKDGKKDEKKGGEAGALAPQPIFKPLISEKGKSKSSGRTIGGWL